MDITDQSTPDIYPLMKQILTMDNLLKAIYKFSFISTFRILALTMSPDQAQIVNGCLINCEMFE